MSLDGHELTAC